MSARLFEFDRYINGVLMAEGVTIERQHSFESAAREAARIASRGPNGEVPVLVLRLGPDEIHAPSVERAAAWHELQASALEGQCEAITKDGGWPDRAREADARLHRRSAAALRELMKETSRG